MEEGDEEPAIISGHPPYKQSRVVTSYMVIIMYPIIMYPSTLLT